jgi:hypothetical protein
MTIDDTTAGTLPLWARVLLIRPDAIEAALVRVAASGRVPRTPNSWQIVLGVLRMWHRILFRSETIGTSATQPVRATLRARVLSLRMLRFPFLVAERAIAPLDPSGLTSSPERVLRHLLGAHHDGMQLVYDLELLEIAHPGWLEQLRTATRGVVEKDDARSRWMRDLCVYEGYHEHLLEAVERASRGELAVSAEHAANPDITFRAYLAWCARQPATPAETLALLRTGRFHVGTGRVDAAGATAASVSRIEVSPC